MGKLVQFQGEHRPNGDILPLSPGYTPFERVPEPIVVVDEKKEQTAPSASAKTYAEITDGDF